MLPTEEEFNAWKTDPTTLAAMELFAARRLELMEDWAHGSADAQGIGMCQALEAVINLKYEDLENQNGE